MRVPLSHIYIPPEKDARIRDPQNLATAASARSRSIMRFGQLQPILVEAMPEQEGKVWKLIDGQVRYVAMLSLSVRHEMKDEAVQAAFVEWDMTVHHIDITTRNALDPIVAKMMEFHANEDRDNFTWDEKGKYIRGIHDMLIAKHGKEWNAKKTAEYTGQSEATLSHYLQLTDKNDPATSNPRVLAATTKGAALKQLQIVKSQHLQQARIAATARSIPVDLAPSLAAARFSVYNGDCRKWIKKLPDSSLQWFHWDPPFGGDEGDGGAFSAHEGIQTDTLECMELMQAMLPEIWRVLHDGAWLAIWYTPVHYQWLRYMLQGHRFSEDTSICLFCGRHLIKNHGWLSENYSCRNSPFRFWVNPYPCVWRKSNRYADAHEITRFLTKETEYFLLAGKQNETTPVLLRSDRGNVFDFPGFAPHDPERRHVHHKPAALLSEILSLISVPGALGGDAGAGSGSILEAAYGSSRKIIAAEIHPLFHQNSLAIAMKAMVDRKVGPDYVAPWLEKAFTKP